MIWRVVRHEWLVMSRQRTARGAAVLLLAATLYSLFGGTAWQEEWTEEAKVSEQANQELWGELRTATETTGVTVGTARTFAVLPPGPLAFLTVGLADLYPEQAEISIWKRPDTLYGRYQIDSPSSLLAGRFDLSFVILYLLPLLLLALSYDLVAAEREQGTLPLLLAQPLGLTRLLAGKLLARAILLTLFLGALGLACLAWVGPGAEGRLAGWFAVAWLYGVFWLAAAGLIACFVRRSETCAAAMITVWLLAVVVVPGLLNVAIQSLSPTPSRLEFVTDMRTASNEAAQERAELLAQYYHEHPELASDGQQSGFLPTYFASQREVDRRLAPIMDDFAARLAGQQRLLGSWRFASPAVVAQEAFVELAGAGLERQRYFDTAARELLEEWHVTLAPRIFRGEPLMTEDLDQLPQLVFAEPPVSWTRLAGSAAGLVLPVIVFLALSFRRLRGHSMARDAA